jgi:hypothetical protein
LPGLLSSRAPASAEPAIGAAQGRASGLAKPIAATTGDVAPVGGGNRRATRLRQQAA